MGPHGVFRVLFQPAQGSRVLFLEGAASIGGSEGLAKFLVSWSAGPLVLWSRGPLVLWSLGPLGLWHPVPWSLENNPIMQAVCLQMGGGATSSPAPALFTLCKITSSIILPAKTEAIWTLSQPVIKMLCLQMGGGLRPPPTPALSFYAVQACFREHRTLNKTWFKHIVVISKPIMQAVYLQMGGGRFPQSPPLF